MRSVISSFRKHVSAGSDHRANSGIPITFTVERLRDGKSYATR